MIDQTNAPAPAGGESMPVAQPSGETPAPADKEAPAPSQDSGSDAAAETTETDEADGEGQPKKPVKGGFQKRIDTLTREKRELERRYHELASAAITRGAPAPQQQRTPTAAPKPEQFSSYEDYLRADKAYTERDILAKAKETVKAELRAEAERESFEAKRRAFNEATEKAKERYEDYEEVVFDPTWHDITVHMRDVIAESDKAADLSYWLATHRDDAARISKLSPLAQARELGRIEATLQPPVSRKTTAAPDPIKTVAGKERGSTDPDKMDMKAWLAWRNKQLASQ